MCADDDAASVLRRNDGTQHLERRSQRGESSGRASCFRTNEINFDQDFHFKRRKLCLSSSVVIVCVAAAGSRVLPARRSAEVLRDTTIRESDGGQRHRHLPHRHGTPHQLSEFSHQGAVNTLVESSHTFEIHFDNETKLTKSVNVCFGATRT